MPEIAASPIEPLPKPPFGHKADQMKQAAPTKASTPQLQTHFNDNGTRSIKNMACNRSESGNAEGGQFSQTRRRRENGIFTTDRVKFETWPPKMKNNALKK